MDDSRDPRVQGAGTAGTDRGREALDLAERLARRLASRLRERGER